MNRPLPNPCLLTFVCLAFAAADARGFDYEAHRDINGLALSTLPPAFPDFVKAPGAAERIRYLSGEPDRWRNTPDNTFKHWNNPDHYFDVDELAPLGLSAERLSPFRHLFTSQLAEARLKNRSQLPAIDPAANQDHTRELVGYLPWAIAEHFSQLKSSFSSLKAYEEAGTAAEVANARASVIYYMGVLGHYIGDAAQPLHTTRHFNGWVGPNPKGYTTSRTFHAWIDGGYLHQVPVDLEALKSRLRTAQPIRSAEQAQAQPSIFTNALAFVRGQYRLVEPLYQLERDGKLAPDAPNGHAGRAFFEQQFVTAAQLLGDLWVAAWQEAPPDSFLRSYLARRTASSGRPSS
jgi:hypothetical protein